MRKSIVGFIILISLNNLSYAFPKNKGHNFVKGFKTYSFKIKSEKLNQLLVKKLMLEKGEEVWAEVRGENSKINIKLMGSVSNSSLKNRLHELFLKKAKIFLGEDFKNWIDGFEITETKLIKLRKYEDISGLNDIGEISIKEDANKVHIEQLSATGAINTDIFYINPPWAGDRSVLTRVVRELIDGNKSEKSWTHFSYKKLENSKWILDKIKIETHQKVNLKSTNDIIRKINEEFQFYDYQFD